MYKPIKNIALGTAALVLGASLMNPVYGFDSKITKSKFGKSTTQVEEIIVPAKVEKSVVPTKKVTPKPQEIIKQQDTRPKTPVKTRGYKPVVQQGPSFEEICLATPIDTWAGFNDKSKTLVTPECDLGRKGSQRDEVVSWLKSNYGTKPINVYDSLADQYVFGSVNNGVLAFDDNGKLNRTLENLLRDKTGSGDGRINNVTDTYLVDFYVDTSASVIAPMIQDNITKDPAVVSQNIEDTPITGITQLPSGIYMFADNENSALDAFALEKDTNGEYTGFTKAVYDGDIENTKRINTKEHMKRIRAGFDNTGFFKNRDERYMGLVHVLNDKTSGMNGAEGLLNYIAEAQNVVPMSVADLSTFVDVVAFNDYMDDKDNLSMNKDKKLELIERYRKLGVSSSVLDKITDLTSIIGVISYMGKGVSFDRSNNLTGHGSVNYMPNQLVIGKALKNGSFGGETLLDRFKQNKLTYEANLGEVSRK
jgi:hypothetical protein